MSNELVTSVSSAALSAAALDHLERFAESGNDHTPIKYSKGEWIIGDKVVNGQRFIAQVDKTAHGWRKWRNAKIVDIDIGYIAEGFMPKKREQLDDLEGSTWEMDTKGERKDPWQFGVYCRFVNNEGEAFIWSATSYGAQKAVRSLQRAYVSRVKRGLFGLPIIALNSDFYVHKQFGKVHEPLLDNVGWTDDAPAIANTPPSAAPTQSEYESENRGADALDDIIPW